MLIALAFLLILPITGRTRKGSTETSLCARRDARLKENAAYGCYCDLSVPPEKGIENMTWSKPFKVEGGPVLRVLVTYYSDTGNTEKIAKAVFEEASKKHQAQLKKIKDVKPEDLSNYDVVFVGGPCLANDLASPVKKLLNAIPVSPKFKLAGFFTHMSPAGEKRGYGKCIDSFDKIKVEKKVDFRGYYDCQGAPSPQVQQLVKKGMNVPDDKWEEGMVEARKHPSAEDLKKAGKFAEKVLGET
jgi:flavodoxin